MFFWWETDIFVCMSGIPDSTRPVTRCTIGIRPVVNNNSEISNIFICLYNFEMRCQLIHPDMPPTSRLLHCASCIRSSGFSLLGSYQVWIDGWESRMMLINASGSIEKWLLQHASSIRCRCWSQVGDVAGQ